METEQKLEVERNSFDLSKNPIAKPKRDEVLKREHDKFVEQAVMLQVNISLQKKLDPNEMSARKKLSPTSSRDIKRSEHIQMLEKELEGINRIIETVEEQMNLK